MLGMLAIGVHAAVVKANSEIGLVDRAARHDWTNEDRLRLCDGLVILW